jgi:hypothetical protein
VNAWDEPAGTVRQFVGQQGIRYPVLLGGSSAARKYGIRGVPTAFYIDREGTIVGSKVGLASLQVMEAQVKKILER